MRNTYLLHIVCLALFATLFSSCLKEIDNVYDPGPTAAVLRLHGDSAKMMANTRFGWLYDEKFSSFSDGKCLLIQFEYDPHADGNKDAEDRGYYSIHMVGNHPVPQKLAEAEETEVQVLLPHEQPIPYAINPNDKEYYCFMENYLFLPSVCLTTRSQSVDWQLTYDPNQQPIVENRKSVYALYLHAVATTEPLEGAEVEEPIAVINAFDLSSFLRDVRSQSGRDADISIQIHYVDRINPQDSSQFTRSVTEPLSLKTTK